MRNYCAARAGATGRKLATCPRELGSSPFDCRRCDASQTATTSGAKRDHPCPTEQDGPDVLVAGGKLAWGRRQARPESCSSSLMKLGRAHMAGTPGLRRTSPSGFRRPWKPLRRFGRERHYRAMSVRRPHKSWCFRPMWKKGSRPSRRRDRHHDNHSSKRAASLAASVTLMTDCFVAFNYLQPDWLSL